MSFCYLTVLIPQKPSEGVKIEEKRWKMEQIGRRSNHPYQGVLSHCFELTCKFYQFLNNFHCRPDTPNSPKSSSSPSQFDPNLISKYLNIQISNLVHFLKIPIQPLYILPLNPTLADSAFFLWKIARILATYFVTKVRKLFCCWQNCINWKSTSLLNFQRSSS